MDAEALTLDVVRAIVAEGYYFGLGIPEIEDDVVEHAPDTFMDADLVQTGTAEFELTLLPAEPEE